MDIVAGLQNLGLTEKESKVYLALLQIGQTSAYSVAVKSGLKKPTTYVILDELVEKGLVSKIPRVKKKLFVARPPQEVFALAEERLKVAKGILPELSALTKLKWGKVHTRYFEGLEQVKNAYFDTLNYPGETIGWVSEAPFKEISRDFWYKEYQPKRIKNDIHLRLIVPDTELMREYSSDDASKSKETRINRSDGYRPLSELLIYGDDRVVITSFEEMIALIIESKNIYELLKGIFEANWLALGDSSS